MAGQRRPKRYTIQEHRHRFACWAAARAAQRGFAKTQVLVDALEATELPALVRRRSRWPRTARAFETIHRRCCRSIQKSLRSNGIDTSFGRAAKLVAIYLKATIVLEYADSAFASVVHPPFDALLLQQLAKTASAPPKTRAYWRRIRWTQLDEGEYYALVTSLRPLVADTPFWMLEQHWNPAR